ncbi:Arginine--tRNA ligase, cytoplasmic [Artemisia annua]|uniref:Arginine--tRNA ligase, cytoplasmic n=1 Tax=Artemisia annua TaxID=35608 RepID=A0A2U1PPA8_ARTAN|nr:Arginine--tRNA ligase, cytoplasmic [Artemisia annua]
MKQDGWIVVRTNGYRFSRVKAFTIHTYLRHKTRQMHRFTEGKPNPLIVIKRDGGCNYASTDLAALWYRLNVEKAEWIIYLSDVDQKDHFHIGNSVILSVWNEMATKFEAEIAMECQHPIIMAVSSCLAKRYGCSIQLSGTPATSYYLNPEILEAAHIRAIDGMVYEPVQNVQQKDRRNTASLALSGNQLFISLSQLLITNETYHIYSYCFKSIIADVTGSALLTWFSP